MPVRDIVGKVGQSKSADSGMKAPVPSATNAGISMFVEPVPTQVIQVRNTSPHLRAAPVEREVRVNSAAKVSNSAQSGFRGSVSWTTQDFLAAHREVQGSGLHNFEDCKISIPTCIRYDRLRSSLGEQATAKEQKVLKWLEFGFPIDCNPNYGITKPQKNHQSAVEFKDAIQEYLRKNINSQAMLGPFEQSPISGLSFSPLMSVPKENAERRVIVDFSFPPGASINDGTPQSSYLDCDTEFNLPSVQSMVGRINELGRGCLLYKRDLKGAFRQFSLDPGSYKFTGLQWQGKVLVDTRLAMGLRSSAFCCQAVTEMVAKVVSKEGHVLVYLDDFGGAESKERATRMFNHLGKMLVYFGLEEAPDKAVAPTTSMDWLGIHFNTEEWTMALKQGKLDELLDWLPRLLERKRVKRVLLQKILGSLVWASAVVRSGAIFFNRLLMLLRKLKRPHHSIHFSAEAKKDVLWWVRTLSLYHGKSPIPPVVWTPLATFSTDASLEGFGMVWGKRAIAGLFTCDYDDLDISKKEMLTVVVAIKHWFADLSNLKVLIFIDNQACVSLLNYGITKSPFLASCLREIQFYLAKFNIEIKAQYIPSKQNVLADLCSRAFSSDLHFRNFNKLLNEGTLILENVCYEKFRFEYKE